MSLIVIDPAEVLRHMDEWDRFLQRLPDPDADLCGSRPGASATAQVEDMFGEEVVMTACFLDAGHNPIPDREQAHQGLLVSPVGIAPWTWIAVRELGQVVVQ